MAVKRKRSHTEGEVDNSFHNTGGVQTQVALQTNHGHNYYGTVNFSGVQNDQAVASLTSQSNLGPDDMNVCEPQAQSSLKLQDGHAVVSISDPQKKRQHCLKSLKFHQFEARYATIKKAHAKTYQWLLNTTQYREWLGVETLGNHHGFLWLRGKPATGKSTMIKFAFTHAKKEKPSTIVVAFFFNARGERLEKTIEGMYRSLLFQIFEKLPALHILFDSCSVPLDDMGNMMWRTETLKTLLMEMLAHLENQSLICFVDALDECEEEEVRDMVRFFEDLSQSAISCGIYLRVFFASRHYPHITIEKGVSLTLEDQQDHGKDIEAYLKSEMRLGSDERARKLQHDVLARASGIFLWAVLVVSILNKEYDRGRTHALQKRLDDIPDKLEDLFDDILTRDDHPRAENILCLQWVLYARRPLTLQELYFAILAGHESEFSPAWNRRRTSYEDMTRYILDCSKGLVEETRASENDNGLSMYKNEKTVQFIHESVREFFMSGSGLHRPFFAPSKTFPTRGQESLKRSCYQYCKRVEDASSLGAFVDTLPPLTPYNPNSFEQSKQAVNLRMHIDHIYPFLQYAVQNVLYHSNLAQDLGCDQDLFIKEFVLQTWIGLSNLLLKHGKKRRSLTVSLLRILAEQGLAALMEAEIQRLRIGGITDKQYCRSLVAAQSSGNHRAVKVLLSAYHWIRQPRTDQEVCSVAGRDLDNAASWIIASRIEIGKSTSYNLLLHAAAHGGVAVARLVLANPDFDNNVRTSQWQTALSKAATGGHAEVVALLLAVPDIDVNLQDSQGQTALSGAVAGGHAEIVTLLLRRKGLIFETSSLISHIEPLLEAYNQGHLKAMQVLLEQAEARNPESSGLTSSWWAEKLGFTKVVEICSKSIDEPDGHGRTLLSYAAGAGDIKIVELLLTEYDADVTATDREGDCPLSHAASNGETGVMKLLLEHNRDAEGRKPPFSGTALASAAQRGRMEAVQLLLEYGCLGFKDQHGKTALSLALQNGHSKVAKLLTPQNKADVDKVKVTDVSLAYAVMHEGPDVVKSLLAHKHIAVNTKDAHCQTPLHRAIARRDLPITKLLLARHDIDVNATNAQDSAPLHYAVRYNFLEAVKLLLDQEDIVVNLKNLNSQSALDLTNGDTHPSIIDFLIAKGGHYSNERWVGRWVP